MVSQTVFLAYVLAILAGLIIELFFQLVHYKDSLSVNAPRDVNYMSVTQYVSGGRRKWFKYFLFRLLPPVLIMLLLVAVLQRYLGIDRVTPYLLASAIVSLVPRDIYGFLKKRLVSEKILHLTFIVLVLVLAYVFSWIGSRYDLSFVAPSPEGLFDSLWSALLVAMLVLLYMKITNMGQPQPFVNAYEEQNAHDNYVVSSFNKIYKKHDKVIKKSAKENICSVPILYAVLIHENMNRPAFLRRIENMIVRGFGVRMTVGLAQVRSDKPLSDEESIKRAAKILEGTKYISSTKKGLEDIDKLQDALEVYNPSSLYAESIAKIMDSLLRYAPKIFKEYRNR